MAAIRVESDYVVAVFYFLTTAFIPADMPVIQKIFNQLSKDLRFCSLFADFIFDESCAYPRCRTIEFTIDRLLLAGLIYWDSRRNEYNLENLETKRKDLFIIFNEDELTLLKLASKRFEELIFSKAVLD